MIELQAAILMFWAWTLMDGLWTLGEIIVARVRSGRKNVEPDSAYPAGVPLKSVQSSLR